MFDYNSQFVNRANPTCNVLYINTLSGMNNNHIVKIHEGAIVLIRARLGVTNVGSGMHSNKEQPLSLRTGSFEVNLGTLLLFLEQGY